MRIRCMTLAVLALAGCGGESAETPDGGAPPAVESAAPAAVEPVPAPAGRQAAAPAPSPNQLPTAADSAAALAEDVSPEWKMRSRQGEPFSSCMEKTVNAPPTVRQTLVDACHRLPDAPKR